MRFLKCLRISFHIIKCNIYYMFRPFHVIGVSLEFLVAVFAIFFYVYINFPSEVAKDIAIAMITGVCASVPLTIFIEIANNRRQNKKRYIILSDLYKELSDYEFRIQLRTGTMMLLHLKWSLNARDTMK